MANRDPESRGGTKNRGNSSYPPAYYSSGYHVESTETQQWSSWLVPLIVVANVAMFFVIMYVNDCPKNNSGSRGNCVAKFLGRLSYQPLKENPIFGSSSSVEGEKLDAGTETNANLDHQLYYHFLGTAQSEDILCWRDADNPKHTFIASVTEDGKRITEQAGVVLTLDLKPIDGDWNGAGCHTNYSTKSMREEGGFEVIKKTILNLSLRHKEHISAYGEGNEIILTGKHETASINTFSWGVANRGCSVRVGCDTEKEGKGTLLLILFSCRLFVTSETKNNFTSFVENNL